MAGNGGQWQAGTVRFDSAAEFDAELDGFISKGAVRVALAPTLPEPLVPFDFQLLPPGGAPVPLRGMIVSQTAQVVLVQILDFSQALATTLRAPRLPRPTPTGLETVPATTAGAAAGSVTSVPLLATRLGQPRATLPPEAGTVAAAPRPAGRTVPPPAGTTIPPPVSRLSSVLPIVGNVAGAAGGAESFEQTLDWATPSPTQVGPAMTGVFPIMSTPSAAGPITGLIVNPQGLDGLLQLPLGPIAAVRDLASVPTVGLLRFMGARRASGWLTMSGDAGGERRVGIDRGSFLLSPQEREQLRPIFQWPTGRYTFEPATPDRPPHRLAVSAWRLVLDFVRLVIREARPDDLAARVDATLAVRLTAAFAERARTLDLQPAEERIVRRDFNGRLSLREIYKLGAMAELSVQRLVLLLQALGLCELIPPEGGATTAAVDEVRAHYERLISSDLFAALGVHWSDPPERLPAALEAVRTRYRPGSPAAASSPIYSAKLIELAERAHRRLAERSGRRAYRLEMGVDVRHAAELLVQQVPLAKARGEYRKAAELMNAACDLFDRPDWERLRAELAQARPPTG